MRRTLVVLTGVLALLALLLPPAQAQRVVVIRAWTIGPDNPSVTRYNNLVTAAERLNSDLRREGAGVQVKVEGFFDTTNWDSYLRRVLLGFQSNEGPDIVQANASLNATWAEGGFIIPLDAYLPRHRQFADVVPSLWDALKYKGKIWGVPQDTEARPLYFNKVLLRQLGWTEAQIAALPDRLAKGDFTWDDVLAAAREAVQKRVIEAGKGYYHRPVNGPDFIQWYRSFGGRIFDEATGRLVITRAALLRYYTWIRTGVEAGVIERDRLNNDWNRFFQPVTDGKVLFFSGGTWQWAEMAQLWVHNKGGEEWLFATFGYGPHPTHVKGGKAITMSNPQAYFVSAKSANKDLAVRLLAYTTTPDLDAKHAVGSAHLPVLKTTARMINNRFLKEVSYLLNYTTFAPAHPDLSKWQDAIFRGLSAVESGQVPPAQGVEFVVNEMQRTIGNQLLVE
ncbi:MAG: extracellular solute-binding protein [Armatimonadota bacterium]|nr:extracellular solute-binding protein [Armatimonadota bacterium]MDR7452800.1 extracellular solute-binding protein [Armatimonadota bacterium]MDR7468221.1 extracellular solute-binding protein [Armatimonadota bacterium]MDR7494299.1 extracellular solute-binding protein [Armatimonadota bacterium]MDR7500526.1 extracellular solute-binding protein [Armatimonadota bacterium]